MCLINDDVVKSSLNKSLMHCLGYFRYASLAEQHHIYASRRKIMPLIIWINLESKFQIHLSWSLTTSFIQAFVDITTYRFIQYHLPGFIAQTIEIN